jgi:hypothetical protein
MWNVLIEQLNFFQFVDEVGAQYSAKMQIQLML